MSMGKVRGKTFVKLMKALVESALMYGVEEWESVSGLIDCIEQVHVCVCVCMRACVRGCVVHCSIHVHVLSAIAAIEA